jgi:hypothetical protein
VRLVLTAAPVSWQKLRAPRPVPAPAIFASGLLVCFSASLDPALKKQISTGKSADDDAIRSNLANHIKNVVMLTLLEIFERSVKSYEVATNVAKDLFAAYGWRCSPANNTKGSCGPSS